MVERREFFKGKPMEKGLFESVDESFGVPRPALPSCIEFRRKVNSWFSFPYSYLVAVEFAVNGSEADTTPHVTAYFSGYAVRLFGSNLLGIYNGIRGGTLAAVAEMDQAEIMEAEETAPIVELIEIAEA